MTTYGSVCSGIEAASCAWHPLGWRAEWFAEIEPFPSAVLAHRWPEVTNHGDMTLLAGQVLGGAINAPEILVGGTPCQAFSLAGMRQGMLDPRGALTIKYVELADAIDHVRTRDGRAECITVWENVPGVLSDKGNAFGCFLGALVGESDALQPSGGKWTDAGCVYGPRRTVAWRVLDAQYFGLAQRRRRVFVVASARAGFDPAAVLFESEGVRRDTAPRRGEGEDVAAGTLRSTDGGSDVDHARAGHLQPVSAFGGNNTSGPIDVAPARNACASASGRMDFESEAFVVHGTQDPDVRIDQAHTLGRNNGMENAVLAFSCKDYANDATEELSPTLRAMGHGDSHANAGGQVAVCVTGDITHTLKADGFDGFDGSEDGTGRGQPIVFDPTQITSATNRSNPQPGDPCHTLAKGQQPPTLAGSQVRRLTPRECERLQGLKDDYTLIPWDGWRKLDSGETPEQCIADGMKVRQAKKSKAWYVCDADGPRYKAIGNSKAVPVVRWIGRRIQRELERAQ